MQDKENLDGNELPLVDFQIGNMVALARIYDCLLILIAQGDSDTAEYIQNLHAQGAYLYPFITPPEENDTPPENS